MKESRECPYTGRIAPMNEGGREGGRRIFQALGLEDTIGHLGGAQSPPTTRETQLLLHHAPPPTRLSALIRVAVLRGRITAGAGVGGGESPASQGPQFSSRLYLSFNCGKPGVGYGLQSHAYVPCLSITIPGGENESRAKQ